MYRALERIMAMDEDAWRRHANPWSVWTRFGLLPLLALAAWSRVWIGPWWLVPLGLVVFWTWYNPRAFYPPAHTNHWASRGVLGERRFLARKTRPIPRHHEHAALLLGGISFVGIAVLVYGLMVLQAWTVMTGLVLAMGAKAWFVDRMVWLHDEVHAPGRQY